MRYVIGSPVRVNARLTLLRRISESIQTVRLIRYNKNNREGPIQMGKHGYDDFTEVSDIMSCTRIHPFGISEIDTITIIGAPNGYTVLKTFNMVPSRPTGAHRQSDDTWNNPYAVILFDNLCSPRFECPRAWEDGIAVDFEYIFSPSV